MVLCTTFHQPRRSVRMRLALRVEQGEQEENARCFLTNAMRLLAAAKAYLPTVLFRVGGGLAIGHAGLKTAARPGHDHATSLALRYFPPNLLSAFSYTFPPERMLSAARGHCMGFARGTYVYSATSINGRPHNVLFSRPLAA